MQKDMNIEDFEELGVPQEHQDPPGKPEIGEDLGQDQREAVGKIIREFHDVFNEYPGEAKVEH